MSCAFAAQTKADHAHHTSARTSIERPSPAHVRSLASSSVTWVTAKTNTRSHSSSTGLVRRSSAIGSVATRERVPDAVARLASARSSSAPAARTRASSPGRPTSWSEAGSPSSAGPHGSARTGAPTTLQGNVRRIAARAARGRRRRTGGATISSVGAEDEVDVLGQRGDLLAVAVAFGPRGLDLGVAQGERGLELRRDVLAVEVAVLAEQVSWTSTASRENIG